MAPDISRCCVRWLAALTGILCCSCGLHPAGDFVVTEPGMVQYNVAQYMPPERVADPGLASRLAGIRELLSVGRFDEALSELDDVLAAGDEDRIEARARAYVMVLRGIAIYSKGDIRGALRAYSDGIAIDDEYWLAYFHRWRCNLLVRDFGTAEADRQRGLSVAPAGVRFMFDRQAGVI